MGNVNSSGGEQSVKKSVIFFVNLVFCS